MAGEAQDLLELGPFDTARWLGLRVAPLLSDTILCLLTAGAATLAVRTLRVAARYLPDLKTLSRLARSLDLPDLSPAGVTPEGLLVDVPDGMPEVGGARDETLLALMRGDEGTDLLSDVEDIRRGRLEPEPDGDRLEGAFVEGLPLDIEAQGSRVTGKVGAGMRRRPRHHVFPDEHRAWFEDHGFVGEWDIDHLCVELDEGFHQAVHGGGDWRVGRALSKARDSGQGFTPEMQAQLDAWTGEWNTTVMRRLDAAEEIKRTRFGDKATLTRDEVVEEVRIEMARFGIEPRFVRYRE